MFSNIFLVCDGCLVFDMIGFLKNCPETKHSVVWTSGGSGSLLVLLKCLGYNYDTISDRISSLKCLPALVFGGNLEVGSEESIRDEVEEWLDETFSESMLFDKTKTLKDVYKLTGIFPNFLTYKDKVVSLNPHKDGDVLLYDAVLASLSNFGVFETHNEYGSFSLHDPFPYYLDFKPSDKECKTLFLSNYSIPVSKRAETYVNKIENNLARIYFQRMKQRSLQCENVVIINGYFEKDYDTYTIDRHLANGYRHSEWYRSGENTNDKMNDLLSTVKSQV